MSDLYIDTPPALAKLCAHLRDSPWIALDTEFIRERTYYPQLCLIQVANEELVACIDPLALDQLDPLWEILYAPAILKVLHAAFQDLEIFFYRCAKVPNPVFDTQIAATMLGEGDQIGYATLVKKMFNIELDKSQTRTDWSHRPLTAEQLVYAADDVRYLRDIYTHQRTRLETCNRLQWLSNDFDEIGNPDRYRIQPYEAWRRVRGCQQLQGVQLAVLRALAAWREEQACSLDRPRRWILGDEALLNLARQLPTDWEHLKRIRGLEPSYLRRHGQTLLTIIASARHESRESWPIVGSRQPLSVEQEALMDAMMALVRRRGAENSISPQTLASRKDLERLLRGDENVPLLHGWRFTLAGREVWALLQG